MNCDFCGKPKNNDEFIQYIPRGGLFYFDGSVTFGGLGFPFHSDADPRHDTICKDCKDEYGKKKHDDMSYTPPYKPLERFSDHQLRNKAYIERMKKYPPLVDDNNNIVQPETNKITPEKPMESVNKTNLRIVNIGIAVVVVGSILAVCMGIFCKPQPGSKMYDAKFGDQILKAKLDSAYDRGVMAGAVAQMILRNQSTNINSDSRIDIDKLLPLARTIQGPEEIK